MYKIVSWAGVIIWMVIIFYLSSQAVEQSNNLSNSVTEVVVETVEKVAPKTEIDIKSLNHIIRKNAHFFSYLVLGILVLNAFHRSTVNGWKSIISALLLCILYAISDEIHQLYVPGRGGQIKDVVIDSAGACMGVSIYLFTGYVVQAIQRKKMLGNVKQ